jgi:RNA polymerase sigma factor (sigma-70 family)
MTPPRLQTVVEHLRTLVEPELSALGDRDLLGRFISRKDEAAFAALVERHGPMVHGVCRRMLRSRDDADDAWQATFLVLARRAGTIRKRASVASWLHGVALRIATKVRQRAARSAHNDLPADLTNGPEADDLSWREVQRILDEELQRLPERLRQPVVLCYLEGKTRDEAAGELGWSLTTFRGRLDTARERLRARLSKRGVTLPAALVASLLTQAGEALALPALRIESTIQSAIAGVVPNGLARLVEGGLRTMAATRLPVLAGMVLAVGLLGGGSAIVFRDRGPADAAPLNAAEPAKALKADDSPKPNPIDDDIVAKVRQSDKIVVYQPGKQYEVLKGSILNTQPIEPLPDWDDRPVAKGQKATHLLFLKSMEEGGQFPKHYPISPKGWYVEHTPELEKKVRAAIELPKEWGPAHALGLRMGLLPRQPRFAKGQDIVIDVCIQNTGAKDITLQQLRYNIYDYWLVHFEVTTPTGEKLRLAKPATVFDEIDTPASRTLKPGETYIHTVRLNRWPAERSPLKARTENDPPPFGAPGVYVVRALYEPGGKRSEDLGPVKSNELRFAVTKDKTASNRLDVEKHLDRLQFTVQLVPDDPKDAANPKHYLRYVMLNVLPIRIEPHAQWPTGKPLGADARITKEQAGKIVAALDKLEFFQHSAGDLPAIERAGPHAKLQIAYRPDDSTEGKIVWRPLGWDLTMVRHIEAIRGCVDGAAATVLDEMLETLKDDKKKWGDEELPLDKLQGRWPLTGQEWNGRLWPVPKGTTGECSVAADGVVRIAISSNQDGLPLPDYEFAGKLLTGAPKADADWPLDNTDKRELPFMRGFRLKGEWSSGKITGKESEWVLWFNSRTNTLKVVSPARATTFYVFERKPEKPEPKPAPKIDGKWGGEFDNGVRTRLDVAKKTWTAGEAVDLSLSVYNGGPVAIPMPRLPRCEVEVDGEWYTTSPAEAPVAGAFVLGPAQVAPVRIKLESGKWILKSVDSKLVPLKLTPGKHTIHVACAIDKRRPVSNAVEIEIVDGKETGWGEASEGLQLRLRAAKTTWQSNEKPSFTLDLRNGSQKELAIGAVPEECLIELNGTVYRYGDGITHSTPVRLIKPDERVNDWLTVVPNEKWIADGTLLQVFHWRSGKNRIRVSFPFNANCKPFSNVIDVEFAESKDTGWGEAVEGVQIRGRAAKQRFEATENVIIDIDVRNRGTKTHSAVPDASVAQLEVDGTWYVSPTVWFFPPMPKEIKPNQQIDKFLTMGGKFWFKRGAAPPPQPLEWKPGKHTVRVAFPIPDKSTTVTAPFEIEIAESKDTGWGDAVEGLQIRGRAKMERWTVDEKPTFELDLRNQGMKPWKVTGIPPQVQVELDGTWYDYKLPLSYPASEQTLAPGGKFEPWLKVTPDSDWSKRGDMNTVLEWKPGKHKVRLGYGFGEKVWVTTAPFEIAIVDPKDLGWGEPVGDFQVRLRAAKTRFHTDEVPVFTLDLRNTGIQELEIPRHPQLTLIQVDEWWYFSPMGEIEPARQKLKPGEQIDAWAEFQLQQQAWRRSEKDWIGPAPLVLGPGKHTIRAAYPVSDKIHPASEIVEFEIGEPKEGRWGHEDGKMQARIRPTKTTYSAGETPEFALDLRNVGKEDIVAGKFAPLADVEVDGVWYNWPIPDIGFPSGTIKAGEQADNWVKVELKSGEVWHRRPPADKSSRFLTLGPGKHTVRMAYLVTGNVMPVSGPVVIEIAEEKAADWGNEHGGFQARLHLANPKRRADEPAAFYLDLKNVGTKEVTVGRWELLAAIQLDGEWHRAQILPLIGYPMQKIKPGEEVDRFVEIRLDNSNWPKGLTLKPGKHSVRISYPCGASQPVTKGIDFEVADGKETGWGDTIEGLQLRGRSARTSWNAGESPGFVLDMRNRGDREWPVDHFPAKTEIEIDGTWYACSILMNDTSRAVHPLKPGEQLDHWITIHPDYTFRARKTATPSATRLTGSPASTPFVWLSRSATR